MDIKKQLGAKIKRIRQKNNLTQDQLAEMMQIAPRTLCGIENGENFVKAGTLERFCEIFNLSFIELFGFDHIISEEELTEEIIKDIKSFKSKDKLEIIYKFIKTMKID